VQIGEIKTLFPDIGREKIQKLLISFDGDVQRVCQAITEGEL
jgi:hypothetical protein